MDRNQKVRVVVLSLTVIVGGLLAAISLFNA